MGEHAQSKKITMLTADQLFWITIRQSRYIHHYYAFLKAAGSRSKGKSKDFGLSANSHPTRARPLATIDLFGLSGDEQALCPASHKQGARDNRFFVQGAFFWPWDPGALPCRKLPSNRRSPREFAAFGFDSYDCVAEWENGSEERSKEQGKNGHIWSISAYCPSLPYPYVFKWLLKNNMREFSAFYDAICGKFPYTHC